MDTTIAVYRATGNVSKLRFLLVQANAAPRARIRAKYLDTGCSIQAGLVAALLCTILVRSYLAKKTCRAVAIVGPWWQSQKLPFTATT